MSLVFDKDSGIVVPETSEIREEVASDTQDAFIVNQNDPLLNVDSSSPMGQIVDNITAETEASNAEVAFCANMLNPDTARGIWLDAIAKWYFLERKKAEATVVECECSGLSGTVIPYGAYVKDGTGNVFRHAVNTGATIGADGKVTTEFYCTEYGAIAIPQNTVTQIVTVVSGWDSVNNPTAGETGRDEETDAELLARMLQSVAINGFSTVEAIYSKMRSVSGVLDAFIAENPNDTAQTMYGLSVAAHSIAISVVGGEDADVAYAIYSSKDAGCGTVGDGTHTVSYTNSANKTYTYNIIRPTSKTIKCKVTLIGTATSTAEQTLVKQAVVDDFNGDGDNDEVTIASTIYGSRFYTAVLANSTLPIASIKLSTDDGTTWSDSATTTILQSPSMSVTDVSIVFT